MAFVVPGLISIALRHRCSARVVPHEHAPPVEARAEAVGPAAQRARARRAGPDDDVDLRQPDLQLHDQRQRRAHARPPARDHARIRRRSARCSALVYVGRVVRAARSSAAPSTAYPLKRLFLGIVLTQIPLFAARGVRAGLGVLRVAIALHGVRVRRDPVHRRADRALRRRPHALARRRRAARDRVRRQLARRVAAGPLVKANGFAFLLGLLAVIATCSALAILGLPEQSPRADPGAQPRGVTFVAPWTRSRR